MDPFQGWKIVKSNSSYQKLLYPCTEILIINEHGLVEKFIQAGAWTYVIDHFIICKNPGLTVFDIIRKAFVHFQLSQSCIFGCYKDNYFIVYNHSIHMFDLNFGLVKIYNIQSHINTWSGAKLNFGRKTITIWNFNECKVVDITTGSVVVTLDEKYLYYKGDKYVNVYCEIYDIYLDFDDDLVIEYRSSIGVLSIPGVIFKKVKSKHYGIRNGNCQNICINCGSIDMCIIDIEPYKFAIGPCTRPKSELYDTIIGSISMPHLVPKKTTILHDLLKLPVPLCKIIAEYS